MRLFMYLRLLTAYWICLSSMSSAMADDIHNLRSFPLPHAGKLELVIPKNWKDHVDQPSQGLPPSITITPTAGEPFFILITPLCTFRPEVVVPDKDGIRKLLEESADRERFGAVEKTIPIQSLVGLNGSGYYFTATNREPKPGEFKYLIMGGMRVGEIALMFSVITNDSAELEFLTMFKSAKHIASDAP